MTYLRICTCAALGRSHLLRASALSLLSSLIFLLAVPLIMAADSTSCETQEKLLSFGLESDAVSSYVDRGLELHRGAAMQSCAWGTVGGLTLSAWSNYQVASNFRNPRLNEIDLGASYSGEWKKLSYETSVAYFFYPHLIDDPNTSEAWVKVGLMLGNFEPFMVHIVDIKAYSGAYFGRFGVAYGWEPKPSLSIETTASIGWGSPKFNLVNIGVEKGALQLAEIEIAARYTVRESFYFSPHIAVSTLMDQELRDQVDKPSLVKTGIAFGVEF